MSVFEPVGNSIKEKSEVVSSPFPSLQTSHQWGRSYLTPVCSCNVFNGNSNSGNLVSSAQLYYSKS